MSGPVGSMPSLTPSGRPSSSFRSSSRFGSTSTAWRVRSATAIPCSLVSHFLMVLDLKRLQLVGRLQPEHLRQEREVHLERPLDVLGLAEAVALAVEAKVRVRDAAPSEGGRDRLRLRRRDDLVVLTLEEQKRPRDRVGV